MRKNRVKIYLGVIFISILLYFFIGNPYKPNDDVYLRTFDPVMLSEDLNIIVDSIGYSRGSFFVSTSKGDKLRVDALQYLKYKEEDYSNIIQKGYALKKEKGSDSLFIYDNKKMVNYLIIDDLN